MTTGDSHSNNHIQSASQYQSQDVNYEYYESSVRRVHSLVFDVNGLTNYNDCSNQIDELLVGAGIWNGSQLDVVSIGSVDLCAFGGPQLAGFVEGNDVIPNIANILNIQCFCKKFYINQITLSK